MRCIHRMAVYWAAVLALAWAAAAASGAGAAAQGLAAPPAIVLHVHEGIADTSFLAPLERMLAARLAPPVRVRDEDMRLAPARFNFAVSGGGPGQGFRAIVVSLARLQPRAMANGADRDPLRAAMRVARP